MKYLTYLRSSVYNRDHVCTDELLTNPWNYIQSKWPKNWHIIKKCFNFRFGAILIWGDRVDSPWFNWSSGPDSRNDPLAIGSDTILWSWSSDRIPQTLITIGSSDRENTKPNSLLSIESWFKSFTGKYRTEIMRSRLNEKHQTDYICIHEVTMGGVATSFMCADMRASWPVQCTHGVVHDTTRFGHAMFDRYVYVINVIEYIQTVNTRQNIF